MQRKRAPCAAFGEIIAPVFIVGIFALLYKAFSATDLPDTQYLDNRLDVPSLAALAPRLALSNSLIALGTYCGGVGWCRCCTCKSLPRAVAAHALAAAACNVRTSTAFWNVS